MATSDSTSITERSTGTSFESRADVWNSYYDYNGGRYWSNASYHRVTVHNAAVGALHVTLYEKDSSSPSSCYEAKSVNAGIHLASLEKGQNFGGGTYGDACTGVHLIA